MAKKKVVVNGNIDIPNDNGGVAEKKPVIIRGAGMNGDEIKERLLEADSDAQLAIIKKTLRMEGVPQGSIDSFVSRLKKDGKLIFTTAVTQYGDGVKPLAVETIIRDMKLPRTILVNGGKEIFDAGVTYGMKALVAGVRLAQELSQMGISQASPVIRMAQELRAGAGESAREAGQVAAENALAGAMEYLAQQKPGKVDIATVRDPMAGIFARALEPAMTQALGKAFSAFGLGGQPIQSQTGEQVQQKGINLPLGWSMGKKESDKEEE